jgi:hypothetical protein
MSAALPPHAAPALGARESCLGSSAFKTRGGSNPGVARAGQRSHARATGLPCPGTNAVP